MSADNQMQSCLQLLVTYVLIFIRNFQNLAHSKRVRAKSDYFRKINNFQEKKETVILYFVSIEKSCAISTVCVFIFNTCAAPLTEWTSRKNVRKVRLLNLQLKKHKTEAKCRCRLFLNINITNIWTLPKFS